MRHDEHHDDNHLVECVDPIVAAGMADFIEADHEIAPGIYASRATATRRATSTCDRKPRASAPSSPAT